MYGLRKTKDFEKSYKRVQRSGKLTSQIENDLDKVIDLLIDNKQLPARFRGHQLKGKLQNYKITESVISETIYC